MQCKSSSSNNCDYIDSTHIATQLELAKVAATNGTFLTNDLVQRERRGLHHIFDTRRVNEALDLASTPKRTHSHGWDSNRFSKLTHGNNKAIRNRVEAEFYPLSYAEVERAATELNAYDPVSYGLVRYRIRHFFAQHN